MVAAIFLRGLCNQKEYPLVDFQYVHEICSFSVIFAIIALIAIVLDTVNAILLCLEHDE